VFLILKSCQDFIVENVVFFHHVNAFSVPISTSKSPPMSDDSFYCDFGGKKISHILGLETVVVLFEK